MLKINFLKKALDTYQVLSENPYYEKLNLNEEYLEILNLANEIESYQFKVVILGEFSSGKSSIINSFIGRELLPVGFLPTTKQLVKIVHSDDEYIKVNEGKKEILTLQKLREIMDSSDEEMEIGVSLPDKIKDFILYDTPGVNDINEISEKLVFEFIPSADVILFVLDSTQALKNTEMEFLTSIVRQKDIEKFIFILNKKDLISDEINSVKEHIRDTLMEKLSLDKKFLDNNIIPYSAKETLEAIKKGENDRLLSTGYQLLIEKIHTFVKSNTGKLLEDRAKEELLQIIGKSLTKINAAIDKVEGKDKEYEAQIRQIEEEIKAFKRKIEEEIRNFKLKFANEVDNFKVNISNSFTKIKKEVEEKINQVDVTNPSKQEYINTLVNSLIDKEVNKASEKFISNISKLSAEFDSKIFDALKESYEESKVLDIPQVKEGGKFDGFFKVAGAASVPFIAVNVIPSLLGGGILASLVGVGLVVGAMFNPQLAIGLMKTGGNLALKAGEFTAQFMNWLSEGISDASKEMSIYTQKNKYKKVVMEKIDEIEKEILEKINEINPDDYIDNYINLKFPQKLEIENKKNVFETEKMKDMQILKQDLEYLTELKTRLEGILNET